jgi:hypothetical protein
MLLTHLKASSYSPYILQLEWEFLVNELALVPRILAGVMLVDLIHLRDSFVFLDGVLILYS